MAKKTDVELAAEQAQKDYLAQFQYITKDLGPNKPYLLNSSGGWKGEVKDVRNDMVDAFEKLLMTPQMKLLGSISLRGLIKRINDLATKVIAVGRDTCCLREAMAGNIKLLADAATAAVAADLTGGDLSTRLVALKLVTRHHRVHPWAQNLSITLLPLSVQGAGTFDAPTLNDPTSVNGVWLVEVTPGAGTYEDDSQFGFSAAISINGKVIEDEVEGGDLFEFYIDCE